MLGSLFELGVTKDSRYTRDERGDVVGYRAKLVCGCVGRNARCPKSSFSVCLDELGITSNDSVKTLRRKVHEKFGNDFSHVFILEGVPQRF